MTQAQRIQASRRKSE